MQTISSSSIDGIAGGPRQVREVAATLIRVAKERDLPVLLVGHVTKDGSIAGPRLLEHLVDVVCQFEGDRQTALRFVRALKNRFGPTDEVGCFEMTGDGIAEVPDPSGLFLSRNGAVSRHVRHRRDGGPPGAARRGAGAGRRQHRAATAPGRQRGRLLACGDAARRARTPRAHPAHRPTSTSPRSAAFEAHRARRRPGHRAGARAGGERDSRLPHTLAAFGEISLAGEIRPATGAKQRANEADRLGFTTVLGADAEHLREALRVAFSMTKSVRERELDAAF